MRWKTVALILFLWFSILQSGLAEPLAIKASTPVEVSIFPVSTVARGAASTFKIRAESTLPSEDFVIEIVPPEGSQLLSGKLRWRGPIVPGVAREMSVTLRMAADSTPTVSVRSGIQFGEQVRFAASATYVQQSENAAATKSEARERTVGRKGRQVIEYSVK